MTLNLILLITIFVFLVISIILYFIKKEKLKVKYAVIWILLFGLLFIFLLVPGLLGWLTKILGFEMPSNMIFSMILGVLVLINISLTGIVSSQDKKIRLLIQELSIIKQNINKK